MVKKQSNTLFQHPVFAAVNVINELFIKYDDWDDDSLDEEEINQDVEAVEYMSANLGETLKKEEIKTLKKNMNNALSAVIKKYTEEMKGTEY